MKRTFSLVVCGILAITMLSGCQDSPWGIFSPKTDIHIAKIEPFRIALDRDGYDEEDGKAELTPRITNGISAMIKGATVYYISQSNRLVEQRAVVSQVWVEAKAIIKNGSSESSGSVRAQTADSDSSTSSSSSDTTDDGIIAIQVGDEEIYKTMLDRGIGTLLARIVIFGTDENGNDFEISTQMPVALEKKSSDTTSSSVRRP